MSLIMVQRCLSAEPWFEVEVPSQSKENTAYSVMIPYPDDPSDEYICECKGFLHRGHCAHQKIAAESLCRWSSLNGPEEQTDTQKHKRICPRCGGTTQAEAEWVL